jgi:hypothetical protein
LLALKEDFSVVRISTLGNPLKLMAEAHSTVRGTNKTSKYQKKIQKKRTHSWLEVQLSTSNKWESGLID